MKRTIQVRISRGDRQFVAECLDLPVVTQAPTLDELAFNIREAIGLHLEGEDLAALGFSNNPTILATMELDFEAWAQRGSHVKVRRVLEDGRTQNLTVPHHDEIDRGTLHAIYRQACRYIPESELRAEFFTD
jgi:predicted RNase H-like HicB family nuclease/predicted RNA binding protein YcfA (HicA-like mRNA interferase family)